MTNSIEMQLEVLATQMGVHKEDVRMLAQSVVNSIKKDKVESTFIEADDKLKDELMHAYVAHAVKKFEQFVTIYLTRGREEFGRTVLGLIKV